MLLEKKSLLEVTFNQFFNNLELSAQTFFETSSKAYDHTELVQDGLFLLTCMLHQFYPDLAERLSLDDTYTLTNKIFWGKYFYKNGVQYAQSVPESDAVNAWQSAKILRWKIGDLARNISLKPLVGDINGCWRMNQKKNSILRRSLNC